MGRHAHGSGRIPRPQRPHRGSHDRGTGNGRRRGGTTRDLSDRDFAQRRNGRAPRPFAVHHGFLRGMGGVRLGYRHLHRPSDSLRKTRLGSRTAAPHGRTAHPRPAVLHSRRDDDNRPHLHRGDLARRAAHTGGLDPPAAFALRCGRLAGGRHRRRYPGISNTPLTRKDGRLRHHARRGARSRTGDEPQLFGRRTL